MRPDEEEEEEEEKFINKMHWIYPSAKLRQKSVNQFSQMLHTYIANIYFQVTQVCVLWKYNKDDDENGPNTRRCRPVNIFNTVGGGLLDGPDSLNPVKAEE